MPSPIDRLQEVFNRAMEHKDPEERSLYLQRACANDSELLRRVQSLIEAHESSEGFLADDPKNKKASLLSRDGAAISERPGSTVGRYKLLQQIGEGGCGVVYVAEQTEPVRRRVALKIVKLGMDTKSVIARFEAERQALALMDHPNIAKVFDAGSTETGRPYFVMELVRGLKITDYCDGKRLSTNARLDLFIQVCQAIQHAHQKGIIHRDIKPSNILVTVNDGVAVPKVIDFGVAKATGGQVLTDKTVYTAFEQFIGTPAYMSPEQAVLTSLDIDTRSDIYALGVLLYELLTGQTPFDPKELLAIGLDEMRRTIREKEPDRPSTRLSTLPGQELSTTAQRRGLEAPKLVSELRGDLDWIVMKCLEKDRSRRYDTANGLASDIKRHLTNEPVVACPPSRLYEFQKTVRRHKVGFAATAAIVLVLAAGVAVSTWQASRAGREATRAGREATRATAALNELRGTAPAFVAQARSLAATERFDEAIENLDYAIQLKPDEPDYRVTKADLLQCQLKLAEAAAVYREALRLKPNLARAESSAKLCEELLAAKPAEDGKLSRESLSKLHLAMQKQQRPAAELMPVERLLGEERKHLLEYWRGRLKDLPISAEKPLKERLTIRDDGLLKLDLSKTKVADLTTLAEMPLGSLILDDCDQITDFAPLHDLHSLTDLSLGNTTITDLSPLRGLPLTQLALSDAPVYDLTPLQGMKLNELELVGVPVADLSPLAGMPLNYFDATRIPAVDYSPLAGAPLETCWIGYSPIRDLSFLKGSPIRQLALHGCHDASGYVVLEGLKSLELLELPTSYRTLPAAEVAAIARLRNSPTLKSIDTAERRRGTYYVETEQTAEEFWKTWDREEVMLGYLREKWFRYFLDVYPDGRYRLAVRNQPLTDLSFLKDAPIDELVIRGTRVRDLSPLTNLALTYLDIRETQVSDLSPLRSPALSANLRELYIRQIPATDFSPIATCTNLKVLDAAGTALENLDVVRGRKLREAWLSGTRITNITELAGMPLEKVHLANTAVTDISPLLQCPSLSELTLPRDARDVEALRSLPALTRISFDATGDSVSQTAEDFWLEYEYGGLTAETVSTFLEKSVQNPQDTILAMKVAALQAWFGLEAQYLATCKRGLKWGKTAETATPVDLERVAKIASLRPNTDASIREASLRLARKAWKLGANNSGYWYSMTLGMAEYRSSHFQAADEALSVAEQAPESTFNANALVGTAAFYRAMSHFKQGRSDEARALFTATAARMSPCPADTEPLSVSVDHDDLIMWLAYREASALIEGTPGITADTK